MTATTQIMTEADTCRELVTPKLTNAGWGNAPRVIGEQRTFTNGRIMVTGGRVRRGKQKRADYLLYYRRDYPLAVVEAKELGLPAESGVQQAKEYAEILGLKFAYATNGHRTIEIDYTTASPYIPYRKCRFQRCIATGHSPSGGMEVDFGGGRQDSLPEPVDGEHQHAVEVDVLEPGG
jgi:type I site-specific restriction endonuclease